MIGFRKVLYYCFWLAEILFGLLIAVCITFTISVKPGVYIIRHMFNQPVIILDKTTFNKASSKVNKFKDISYPSRYKNNKMDIYYPKSANKARGILIWVHGGGFVAGDKYAIEEFATYIVANNQIAVVAINYETAPELVFPGQVIQLNEAYNFLKQYHSCFISVDFSKVLFGGDSAGGQIAGQYTALQTNKHYADELSIRQAIPSENIQAFIAYSAPLNLQQMSEARSRSLFMKFFVNTVARAVIGTWKWKNDIKLKQASVAEYLSPQFPPSFITDGNTYSFQEQGQLFEKKLNDLNVTTQSLFYADSHKAIPHEYQFNYATEEAKNCLHNTIKFIEEQLID